MKPSKVMLGLVAAVAVAGCHRQPSLTSIVHGGKGPPTLVLLHGYGSSAVQWMPFTKTIRWPSSGRFVFPEALQRTTPPDGPADGRGWWRLELASHIPPGKSLPEFTHFRPPELRGAAELVRETLDDGRTVPPGPLVLGGFSQGAMVASEVAFRSKIPLAALVILSGTVVDEPSWEEHFQERRGLPVFLAHGRSDPVLPFDVSEGFHQKLQAAGLAVTWCPFDGGHEIPAVVVDALNEFLERLSLDR